MTALSRLASRLYWPEPVFIWVFDEGGSEGFRTTRDIIAQCLLWGVPSLGLLIGLLAIAAPLWLAFPAFFLTAVVMSLLVGVDDAEDMDEVSES